MPDEPPLPDEPPVPPELRFARPVVGPSYRPAARAITAATVVGLLAFGVRLMLARPEAAGALMALLAIGAVVMLLSAWYVLTGKTTVDARGIRQDWLFAKSFAWSDIVGARFVRMPVVPRLMVSTGRGPVRAVQSGCPELDAAFEEISRFYGPAPR